MFLTKAFIMSSQPGENSLNIQLSETFTRQCLLDAGLENSKSNIVVETRGVLAMFAYGGVRAMFCV